MYIASVQIENYKSFWKSNEMSLSSNFNIIIGENNAGKTALIETISLKSKNNPHRSKINSSKPNYIDRVQSTLIVTVKIEENELFEIFTPNTTIVVPQPAKFEVGGLEAFVSRLIVNLKGGFHIKFVFDLSQAEPKNAYILHKNLPELAGLDSVTGIPLLVKSKTELVTVNAHGRTNNMFKSEVWRQFKNKIYLFNAERLNIHRTAIKAGTVLASDASNLADVLHSLQSRNKPRYERLVSAFTTIFPHVYMFDTPPIESTEPIQAQIRIWSTSPQEEREDLAIPLSESGTGLGQVLAMLYVIYTADEPQIILIDEPQSFLHPGAIRKLFEIFKQHSQHQYVITTHSPTVLSAANPENILLVKKEDSESKIEVVDRNQRMDMERVLQSVGASLSDVFGADNIMWVEGPTEERCFPEIIRKLSKHELWGTVIKSVVATGDFVQKSKKKVELVLNVYTRLTTSSALLPPAFGFVFDTEDLSQDNISDIERVGADNGIKRVVFLPRTMYENYLLNAEAIASVLSKDYRNKITVNQIQNWFDNNLWQTVDEQKQWNKNYFGKRTPPSLNFEACLETIHGANVLKDLFKALTPNGLVEYDKVPHGYDLTIWLLENKPEQLQPLADFLDEQMTHWRVKSD